MIATKTVAPISKGSGESVLERLKALDAQRAELLEGAKREALDKAETAIADLNSLGFDYRLVEGAATARAPRKTETQTPKRQSSGEPCKICQFRTEPPHDKRRHRGQNHKLPFTVEELTERGLSKVG